jgi:hypothetical protein
MVHKTYRFLLLLFSILWLPSVAVSQITQTLKGSVTDKETQSPLVGATVLVASLATPLGAVTDTNGNFAISNVPVGKHIVAFSYTGYHHLVVSEVVVSSAKEVVLNVEMEESAVKMAEVTVTQKREHINDMALVSAKTFSVQETEKFAGSRADPARMASNYAGVQGGNDSRNDIVIRGNSPQGVLWRLEGIDIPNPNHFAVPGTTGGPASMLNNKTLANSDFFTGAFPAEYGNGVAGVFDLRLRNGNNERHEYTAQLGLLGTELAAEGPLSKKSRSSFLITYRYSTLQLFEGFHIKIGTNSVPRYQDLTFKLNFPMGKNGNLSFFGIGGASSIDLIVSKLTKPQPELYGASDRDQYFTSNNAIAGASYLYNLNKGYFKITVAQTATNVFAHHDKVYRNNNYLVDSLNQSY